ncbi:unnamed protein product [Psylliodes chrysocephalus]|uniref:Cellulase n=1 Tax=Psylliodes chrysocephalus TaxID=3402493 RepID=A0A9P0D5M1_9CUCU|nr:unnamed protein product [Psylliodes chrysocephala]
MCMVRHKKYASAFGVLEQIEEVKPVVGGVSGTGTATRYWDCCKPTCAWLKNTDPRQTPVKACKADGVTAMDVLNNSGCGDGQSFICTDQHGYAKNETLAYGFAAAKFIHAGDRNMCCVCVMFTFHTELPSPLNGKKMLAQVTNTGNDDPDAKHNEFDIAMPGSGVGLWDQGCVNQWHNDPSVWGDRNGGVHTLEDCYKLPEPLQEGCAFRFEWMAGYNNPDVTFEEVTCPKELTDKSGCFPVEY